MNSSKTHILYTFWNELERVLVKGDSSLSLAKELSQKNINPSDLFIFSVPCRYSGKPMLFTHVDEDRDKVLSILRNEFKNWRHVNCSPSSS
ncbi:MAG: hypothetical protein QXQ57_06490 [Sulfolobales archaeon]